MATSARQADVESPGRRDKPRADGGLLKERIGGGVHVARESGKSLLPFSRVQKIMKADTSPGQDIPVVAREAVFLVSLATEEFIKRITSASRKVAIREKRSVVQHKDLAAVVRKVDEFVFLEELMPWMSNEVVARRKPKAIHPVATTEPDLETMLDRYVASSSKQEST